MPTQIFHYKGPKKQFPSTEYEQCVEGEMLPGSLALEAEDLIEIVMDRGLSRPIGITRFQSRFAKELHFRRSVGQIRTNGGDFLFIRFIERGRMIVGTSRETIELEAGSFAMTRGDVPYFARSFPDAQGYYESYQAIVPAHLLMHRLGLDCIGDVFTTDAPAGATTKTALQLIFQHGDTVDAELRRGLVDLFLVAAVSCVRSHREEVIGEKIADRRINEIIRYIKDNAMFHAMTASLVSESCGISRRYMSMLLKRRNLQFGDLVREARLGIAEGLLTAHERKNNSIGEIAQVAGFRSLSYFSRAFKHKYGISPREYRVRNTPVSPPSEQDDEAISWPSYA